MNLGTHSFSYELSEHFNISLNRSHVEMVEWCWVVYWVWSRMDNRYWPWGEWAKSHRRGRTYSGLIQSDVFWALALVTGTQTSPSHGTLSSGIYCQVGEIDMRTLPCNRRERAGLWPVHMVLHQGRTCHPSEPWKVDQGSLFIPSDWTFNG